MCYSPTILQIIDQACHPINNRPCPCNAGLNNVARDGRPRVNRAVGICKTVCFKYCPWWRRREFAVLTDPACPELATAEATALWATHAFPVNSCNITSVIVIIPISSQWGTKRRRRELKLRAPWGMAINERMGIFQFIWGAFSVQLMESS